VLASRTGSAWQQRRPASLPGHRRRNPILGLVTPIAAHAFFCPRGASASRRRTPHRRCWRRLVLTPVRARTQCLCQPIQLRGVRGFAPLPHPASRRFVIELPVQWSVRRNALRQTPLSPGSGAANIQISALSLPRVAKGTQVTEDARSAERRMWSDADR